MRLRFISSQTLLSLQILQSESHPHSHNQGPNKGTSGSKEGLSVYGLFHRFACTPQGKNMLRQYFLRPSLSLEVISERLNTTSVFLRPENYPSFDAITKALRSIVNARTLLIKLRSGVTGGSARAGGIAQGIWSGLRKVCRCLTF